MFSLLLLLAVFITPSFAFAQSSEDENPPKKLGDLNCTISVSWPGMEEGVFLKRENEFGIELIRNQNEYKKQYGAFDYRDFNTDYEFPGEIQYDIFHDEDKGNPTGFELPGSELAFLGLKYIHRGKVKEATAIASAFFSSALVLEIRSSEVEFIVLNCTPIKAQPEPSDDNEEN